MPALCGDRDSIVRVPAASAHDPAMGVLEPPARWKISFDADD